MTVLSREALEQSPLADLHLLARELGIDGFRRLRKAELVDAIIAHQSGEDDGVPAEADVETDAPAEAVDAASDEAEETPKPRRRRGGRGRRKAADEDVEDELLLADELRHQPPA